MKIQLKWSDEEVWKDFQEIPKELQYKAQQILEAYRLTGQVERARYKHRHYADLRIVYDPLVIQIKRAGQTEWERFMEVPELLRPHAHEYLWDIVEQWRTDQQKDGLSPGAEFRIV